MPVSVYKYIPFPSPRLLSVIAGLPNLLRPHTAEKKKTHNGNTKERQTNGAPWPSHYPPKRRPQHRPLWPPGPGGSTASAAAPKTHAKKVDRVRGQVRPPEWQGKRPGGGCHVVPSITVVNQTPASLELISHAYARGGTQLLVPLDTELRDWRPVAYVECKLQSSHPSLGGRGLGRFASG